MSNATDYITDQDFTALVAEQEFNALVAAERERWLAGLPLLHREFLTDLWACDPEEIFSATDYASIRLAGGGTA